MPPVKTLQASRSNQESKEKYASIAEEYDQRYQGPFWDLYNHVTLDVACEVLPKAGHVLDAGAGTGKFAKMLLERGYAVTLLEPSSEMLGVARRRIGAGFVPDARDYVVGTIETMDFPDDHFDGVFCEGDPLSYCIKTHAAAAKELVRVLRPGGTFYVSCDNRWHATLTLAASGHVDKAFEAANKGISTDPYGVQVHAFDPDELQHLFEDAGAVDVRVTGKIHLTHILHPKTFEAISDDPERARTWYAIETELARKPSMAGLAGHYTVVGRKPEEEHGRSQ